LKIKELILLKSKSLANEFKPQWLPQLKTQSQKSIKGFDVKNKILESIRIQQPSLFLFSTNIVLATQAVANGVDYIIVDWERGAKLNRQGGTGFHISEDTFEDAQTLAIGHKLPVFVRINPLSRNTQDEIDLALKAGAIGIMLPMACNHGDVSAFLKLVPKEIKTLIQIETEELARNSASICDLPWDFVHVGLNDLMISRNVQNIWISVLDGTVERICRSLEGRSFGFGGITVVDGGFPIPARLIILEMIRLGCSMGVLRRSFKV